MKHINKATLNSNGNVCVHKKQKYITQKREN